jgi:FKBP-type peptidyl-prolyl cis-trans isomerase FklB
MRLKAIAATIAAACGLLILTGCDNHKAANKEVAAVPEATYDLSAASNAKFLKDNAAKEGVKTLPSGLQYRVIKTGGGKSPRGGDLVTVTYKGWLISGKVFDQTQPGQTAQFPANRLIPGWVEALQLMKEGDEWELVIPSELGYGEQGAGDDIPPNQVLVFDMQLLKVDAAPQ